MSLHIPVLLSYEKWKENKEQSNLFNEMYLRLQEMIDALLTKHEGNLPNPIRNRAKYSGIGYLIDHSLDQEIVLAHQFLNFEKAKGSGDLELIDTCLSDLIESLEDNRSARFALASHIARTMSDGTKDSFASCLGGQADSANYHWEILNKSGWSLAKSVAAENSKPIVSIPCIDTSQQPENELDEINLDDYAGIEIPENEIPSAEDASNGTEPVDAIDTIQEKEIENVPV